MDTPKTGWAFVAGIFSEPDGTPSASRLLSFLASVIWLTLLTLDYFHTRKLPSPGELIAGGLGANSPYLVNQARRFLEGVGAGSGPKAPEGKN
jgi:hypothetical protein